MLNSMILQGRLTKDVELRHTQSGTAVASFTVAWSETYKGQERKLFLPCVAWGNNGEFISKYFSKGDQIVIEGQLNTRTWTDKDGNNRSVIELTAERVHFSGSKNSGTQTAAPVADDAPELEEITMDNEDLPF